jgi:putative peptidoglycan lipid II flippase
VIFSYVLMGPLKHAGLALANSLSSFLNLILLVGSLRSKLGRMEIRKNAASFFQMLLCSVPMGLVAYLICSFGNWSTSGNEAGKVLLLGAAIVAGSGIYFLASYLTRNEELLFLLKMIRKKKMNSFQI